MHLLNTSTRKLEHFIGNTVPKYAILSHTWGDDEVSMQDLSDSYVESKAGYAKIRYTCDEARRQEIDYAWVDTCCINKDSSAELSEAINSMYKWYHDAEICYAYLSDVTVNSADNEPWHTLEDSRALGIPVKQLDAQQARVGLTERTLDEFSRSRWFTRGWTLQELIAPREVWFFGRGWKVFGAKNDFKIYPIIEKATGIPGSLLYYAEVPTKNICVAQKISWASRRQTTRVEDEAYCLLGLLGVNMPLLYGEGEKAFARLQAEVIRGSTDLSILAWDGRFLDQRLLAPSPSSFANWNRIWPLKIYHHHEESFELTNAGLRISLPLVKENHMCYIALLFSIRVSVKDDLEFLGLPLEAREPDLATVPSTRQTGTYVLAGPCIGKPRIVRRDSNYIQHAKNRSIMISEPDKQLSAIARGLPYSHRSPIRICLINRTDKEYWKVESFWPEGGWIADSGSNRFPASVLSIYAQPAAVTDGSVMGAVICDQHQRKQIAISLDILPEDEFRIENVHQFDYKPLSQFHYQLHSNLETWKKQMAASGKPAANTGCITRTFRSGLRTKMTVHAAPERLLVNHEVAVELLIEYTSLYRAVQRAARLLGIAQKPSAQALALSIIR